MLLEGNFPPHPGQVPAILVVMHEATEMQHDAVKAGEIGLRSLLLGFHFHRHFFRWSVLKAYATRDVSFCGTKRVGKNGGSRPGGLSAGSDPANLWAAPSLPCFTARRWPLNQASPSSSQPADLLTAWRKLEQPLWRPCRIAFLCFTRINVLPYCPHAEAPTPGSRRAGGGSLPAS